MISAMVEIEVTEMAASTSNQAHGEERTYARTTPHLRAGFDNSWSTKFCHSAAYV